MVGEMSNQNDDLDQFARLFGAEPETPPEGLLPQVEATPTATVPPPAAGSPADPLAWLLSDQPATAGGAAPVVPDPPTAFPPQDAPTTVFPGADRFPPAPSYPTIAFANPATAFPTATAPAEPTQALPTRRSVAAEAAGAARDTGRRNLIILASIGAVVLLLVVVLILVLVAKSGSSASPAAISTQSEPPSPTSSSTPSATPTPTPTATETPTPTPTPTPSHTAPPPQPPPSRPTVTAAVSGAQPVCTGVSQTTFTIGYTSANAATLNLTSSDGSINTNMTPEASGTIPSVPYPCGGTGATYTLTVYSSAEGVTPASATVTPVPVD